MTTPDWQARAVCATHDDPDLWHSDVPADIPRAIHICRECPVRTECATYALEHGIGHGVWGATTPSQRGFNKHGFRRTAAA